MTELRMTKVLENEDENDGIQDGIMCQVKHKKKQHIAMRRMCLCSLVVNAILLTFLIYTVVHLIVINRDPGENDCNKGRKEDVNNKQQSSHDFLDLTKSEIQQVLDFLYANKQLKLRKHSEINGIAQNYIYAVELHFPNKSDILNYLDHDGAIPVREAKVILFCPADKLPVVKEYIVSPLPNPTTLRPNKRLKKWQIPFRLRQIGFQEVWQIYHRLYQYHSLEKILTESYGASLFNCIHNGIKRCLSIYKWTVSSANSRERKLWLTLYYDIEYYTLHPVDMQILMNVDSLNTSFWRIDGVWYGQKFYPNFEEFVTLYNNGGLMRVKIPFPRSSYPRIDAVSETQKLKLPASQFEPEGHRYSIRGQRLAYLHWSFRWKMSLTRGPSLFDIRFKGERIVYELALQQIAVLYSGNGPAFENGLHAESFGGLSANLPGLVPGVDCPGHARFIDVTVLTEDDIAGGVYPNSICVFEMDQGRPLRRHYSNSPGHGGIFYSGHVSTALVFRTIFAVNNYDYIIDYVFYDSGHIAVNVDFSGFILTSFDPGSVNANAAHLGDDLSAPIYFHCLNFKVDFDIKGHRNRYIVQRLKSQNTTNQWHGSAHAQTVGIETILRETEQDAVSQPDSAFKDDHIFINSKNDNQKGVTNGYKLSSKNWMQHSFLNGSNFLQHFPWVQYPVAVTLRKEEEESSSSMYASIDGEGLTTNFSNFMEDNENIVDKDLVAWVTIGDYHIPTTENIPNVVTPERQLSFLLSPHNYFPFDPSATSYDSVYIAAKNQMDVKDGVYVTTNQNPRKSYCPINTFDLKSLETNWTHVFSELP